MSCDSPKVLPVTTIVLSKSSNSLSESLAQNKNNETVCIMSSDPNRGGDLAEIPTCGTHSTVTPEIESKPKKRKKY